MVFYNDEWDLEIFFQIEEGLETMRFTISLIVYNYGGRPYPNGESEI